MYASYIIIQATKYSTNPVGGYDRPLSDLSFLSFGDSAGYIAYDGKQYGDT